MGKAIPEQRPLYMGFAHAAAARAYRENAGGWVFVPDNAAGAVWFDAAHFTAGAVMRHFACKGSGQLL
jgi:hypothetical protein